MQPDTKRVLRELDLDETFLYGIDRVNCVGYENWDAYKNGRGVLEHNWMLTPAGLPMGARLVHYYGHEGENGKFEGWRPLGFCQIAKRKMFNLYPQETMGADHCDLLFARQWKRNKRSHIPELLAVHLESRSADNGVNWYGRKSDPFVPGKQKSSLETQNTLTTQLDQVRHYSDHSHPCCCQDCSLDQSCVGNHLPPCRPERPEVDQPKPDCQTTLFDKIIGTAVCLAIIGYLLYYYLT